MIALNAPADIDDDAAWTEYCAALPKPTDAELAVVLTWATNPYADRIAHADEGFRTSARMIWQARRDGVTPPLSYRYLRQAMSNYAAVKRLYRGLAEAAAYGMLSEMHMAAAVEGADAYACIFPEGVWS